MRVMEDGSRENGELESASVTVKLSTLVDARELVGVTARTLWAIGPAEFLKDGAALIVGTEPIHQSHKVRVI